MLTQFKYLFKIATMNTYKQVFVWLSIFWHTHTDTHTCIHSCVYTIMLVPTHSTLTWIHTFMHTQSHMHTHTSLHIFAHTTHLPSCMNTRTCMSMHRHRHTLIPVHSGFNVQQVRPSLSGVFEKWREEWVFGQHQGSPPSRLQLWPFVGQEISLWRATDLFSVEHSQDLPCSSRLSYMTHLAGITVPI